MSDVIQAIMTVETAKTAINRALVEYCDDVRCTALEVESDVLGNSEISIWLDATMVAVTPDLHQFVSTFLNACDGMLPKHEGVWEPCGGSKPWNWTTYMHDGGKICILVTQTIVKAGGL